MTNAAGTEGQRWLRPFVREPGFLKQQLPTKVLAVGARGEVAELRALLKAHPEYLSRRGAQGRTLLWEAARRGRLAAVKWLAARGAELDATGCYNSESMVQLTPYCAARYYRRAAAADWLWAAGARLDVFRAAFLGEQARVAAALAAEPALLLAEDPHDTTYYMPLLAFAVAGGQAALTAWLGARGARGAALEAYSTLLLTLAGRGGRLDLVQWLLDNGAQAGAADTGLFVAVRDLDILRLLLARGLSPTAAGLNGSPPLVYVARGDKAESPEKAALLLEWGAPVDATGPRGQTALHSAAAAGHTAVMRVLLAHGANPALADADGATPLDLARAAGQRAAADLLRHAARPPQPRP